MRFWALWKLWNIISYMTHRGVLRKLFIRSSLRFNWMDYWELFDLSKSKSLTVFDIGSGISSDNLNTGVARNIAGFFFLLHTMHIAPIRCWIFWIPFNSRVGFGIRKTSRCCLWRLSRHGKYSRCNVKISAPFFFWNAAIYTNSQWTAEKGENAIFTSLLR